VNISEEKINEKKVGRIEDLIIRQEELDNELWQSIASKSKSRDPEKNKNAIRLILNNYQKIPREEAEILLISLIEPTEDEDTRIFVARSLLEKTPKIRFGFYSKIVSKLSEDPSEKVIAIVRELPLIKLTSELLERNRIIAEQISRSVAPLAEFGRNFSEHLKHIHEAITISPEILRASQSTISIFRQYSESMSSIMKAAEAYRNAISPYFIIPNEYLEPIRLQVPRLINEVYREGMEQEEIEEIDDMIDELKEYVNTLPIFENVKDYILEGLSAFSSRNFRVAFSTLLDTVEGVAREILVMHKLGGTNQNLSPMAEKLRSEKWIRVPTENLIKSLERDKADHALYGEHSDFPENTSRLVILCLLKVARDYIYFKVLRRCIEEIIAKSATYSQFTLGHLLSLARDIHKMHVERKFKEGKIFLTITLYGRDVFKFQSSGPYWDTI